MKISFAIQAVEQRRAHVEAIVDRIESQLPRCAEFGGVHVVFDTEMRGCWWSWSRAWATHSLWQSTHHVVLQDDVLLCADFPETMLSILKARRHEPVSGFLPRKCVDRAVEAGKHWARTSRFLWAQCVAMPVAMGDACVKWVEAHEGTDTAKPWANSGDMRLADFFKSIKKPVWVPVPHPVEHVGDALPGGSVMGHNGKASGRRARAWLGEDGRGASLPWDDLRFERD